MSFFHKDIAHRIATSGTIRTAGKIEFIRDQGPVRRDIRVEGFKWSRDSLKNLAKILWAAQRSHSYASSALRLLSKMPSSSFSPDGLLGGRGYIQTVKDMRGALGQAAEIISSFTDTLYDEVGADHWNLEEAPETKTLVQDAQAVKTNPEGFVEQAYQTAEPDEQEFMELTPETLNPTPADFGQPEGSGSGNESSASAGGFTQQASKRQTSESIYDAAISKYLSSQGARLASDRLAGGNSSVPVENLPGPRITHVGPGESPYGFFNGPDALPSDDPNLDGFITEDYLYEDVTSDGVGGYDRPTVGDSTSLKTASDYYSWLPGASNDKLMPVYTPGLSSEEIDMMMKHSEPDNPMKPVKATKPNTAWLWDVD
jgi:hypothetical protein